ncbi:diaminopimelate epimerase [Natronomonas sp. EA1]|uniref:diaminopimelate epimerase n=1 Tax=Natronomonas sp. EA1 TaxID=3421655 RepID=UPI003EBE3453
MVAIEKYHGTGNDFVIVDAAEDVPDRRGFAIELCDRTAGIAHDDSDTTGADGILFLALEAEYRPPRVVMTLVQPDGSVAAMCGNGARCAAAWAAERTGADEVMIDTPSGTRHAVIDGDEVEIEMGAPTFDPAWVPAEADEPLIETDIEGLTVTAVNTGVPHAVAFVDDVDEVDIDAVAPAVRHADVFPEGANVTFASREGDGYRQRTFERGVEGETRSCGTGAVAVAAVAHRLGHIETGETVRVSPPGGDLQVTVGDGESFLRGPAVLDFETTVSATPPRIHGD